MAAWDGRFRRVTTSLLGYGGTAERRTDDPSIFYETDVLESVVRKAGGRVHLVGHSAHAAEYHRLANASATEDDKRQCYPSVPA